MSDQSHGGHGAEESALDKAGPFLVWAFVVIVMIVGTIVMTSGEPGLGRMESTSLSASSDAAGH